MTTASYTIINTNNAVPKGLDGNDVDWVFIVYEESVHKFAWNTDFGNT